MGRPGCRSRATNVARNRGLSDSTEPNYFRCHSNFSASNSHRNLSASAAAEKNARRAIGFDTDRPLTWRSVPHALIPKSFLQSRKSFLEYRARRGEIKAQPCLSSWSKLLAGTGKDAGAIFDSVGNLFGGQIGSRKIDPREVGGVETHRACTGHCGLNTRIE